jgi:hypothetical protein
MGGGHRLWLSAVKTAQHYGAERCRGVRQRRLVGGDIPTARNRISSPIRDTPVADGSAMGQRPWDASCCWLPWRRIRLSTRDALPMLTIDSHKGN